MLFHEYLKNEIFKIVKKLLDDNDLESDFLKQILSILNYQIKLILVTCHQM